MAGWAKNELCFFQMPDFDYKEEVQDPTSTALLSVVGGQLDAAAIQTELTKLARVEWNWEALPHGEGTYLVAFPSEEELQRMAEVEYKIKSGSCHRSPSCVETLSGFLGTRIDDWLHTGCGYADI